MRRLDNYKNNKSKAYALLYERSNKALKNPEIASNFIREAYARGNGFKLLEDIIEKVESLRM